MARILSHPGHKPAELGEAFSPKWYAAPEREVDFCQGEKEDERNGMLKALKGERYQAGPLPSFTRMH